MDLQYVANIYSKKEKINTKSGDNMEEIYHWTLMQLEENFGDIHGEIVDSKTEEIVKKVCKSIIE